MKVTQVTENQKEAMFSLMWYCFPGSDEWKNYMLERYCQDNYYVVGEDDKSVSASLEMIPYAMNINGSVVKANGIAVVASRADRRYSGNTGALLKHVLDEANKRCDVFSALAPFSSKFYRNYGWEHCYRLRNYRFDIFQLKKFLNKDATYQMIDPTLFDEWEMREAFYQRYQGSIALDDVQKSEFIASHKAFGYHVVMLKDDNQKNIAYMTYKKEKGVFHVKEIVYASLSGLKDLLGFIFQHLSELSTVEFLVAEDDVIRSIIDEQDIETKDLADMMLRVINVEKALLATVDKKVSIDHYAINILDTSCPWNNGVWVLSNKSGNITVTKDDTESPNITMGVGALTQWCIGYYSLDRLVRTEQCTIHNEQKLEMAKQLFAPTTTYMNERF